MREEYFAFLSPCQAVSYFVRPPIWAAAGSLKRKRDSSLHGPTLSQEAKAQEKFGPLRSECERRGWWDGTGEGGVELSSDGYGLGWGAIAGAGR